MASFITDDGSITSQHLVITISINLTMKRRNITLSVTLHQWYTAVDCITIWHSFFKTKHGLSNKHSYIFKFTPLNLNSFVLSVIVL